MAGLEGTIGQQAAHTGPYHHSLGFPIADVYTAVLIYAVLIDARA